MSTDPSKRYAGVTPSSTPSLLKIMQSLSCGLSLEPSVRSKSVGPYTDMFNDMFAAMDQDRAPRETFTFAIGSHIGG